MITCYYSSPANLAVSDDHLASHGLPHAAGSPRELLDRETYPTPLFEKSRRQPSYILGFISKASFTLKTAQNEDSSFYKGTCLSRVSIR